MMELSYRRHRFPPLVIQHAVWLYLRFTLSYRDVEDLLAERGLDISSETVRSWVLKFGPVIARRLRRRRPRPSDRWHLDEMVVRIAGKRMYLWSDDRSNKRSSWHALIEPHIDRPQPVTLGVEKGYDASDFVFELGEKAVSPGPRTEYQHRRSTIDGCTTGHPGYAISQGLCSSGDGSPPAWRGDRGALSALAVQPLLPHPFGDFDDRFVGREDRAFLPAGDPAHVLAGKIERTVRLQQERVGLLPSVSRPFRPSAAVERDF
jgi:hypothetical protein